MMLTQEELQATNEELEATNEEFQATNEELETSNEELQATNEEIQTTNDELNARSIELQESTRALESERRRLRAMVEAAPFFMVLLRGPELTITACNAQCSALLVHHPIGRPIEAALTAPTYGDLISAAREAYWQDKARVTPKLRIGADDTERWVFTALPTHDQGGAVDGVVVFGENVSEQLARELSQHLERFRLMIEHADQVALGLFDAHTSTLIHASPRYLQVLAHLHQLPADSILGRSFKELAFTNPHDDAEALFRQVLASKVSRRLSEIRRGDPRSGETAWDCSLTPIWMGDVGDDDSPRYVVFSAVEITDAVRAREEAVRLEQLKDQFLMLASHELRTPMVTLIGYSDMLVDAIGSQSTPSSEAGSARAREFASKFGKHLRYMNRLIDDLFDVARLRSGQYSLDRKPFDLAALIADAVHDRRTLSPHAPIDLELPQGDGALCVEGDAPRLSQVLSNLLDNALKWGGEGRITVQVWREGARAKFAVRDEGPGLSDDLRKQIFAPFFQAPRAHRPSRDGLGLGLYIAQQIVEQHGGVIDVASTPGAGSTFHVSLPLRTS
ncbi:MAG: hypothetical protein NVS3B20_15290 [Polyangiales bacterium]